MATTTRALRYESLPYDEVTSKKCERWHMMPMNLTVADQVLQEIRCGDILLASSTGWLPFPR